MKNLPFACLLVLVMSMITLSLPAQDWLQAADWQYRNGELDGGVIVRPTKLWKTHDVLFVKKRRGHQRIPLEDIQWLAIGQDTIWQYSISPEAKGYWQMLVGGDYDLYVQEGRRPLGQLRSGLLLVDWLIMAFGRRPADKYVLQTDSQSLALDFRHPETQLRQFPHNSCILPQQNPYWPSQRKLWRIGRALNDCTRTGTTYQHIYAGSRWEFDVATPLLSPDRKIGERSRRMYGGRLGIVKPFTGISKHLAIEFSFSYLMYRQLQEYVIRPAMFGGVSSFTVSPAAYFDDANFSVRTLFHNRMLATGLRWEIAPAEHLSLTLTAGATWQLKNPFELEGKAIAGTNYANAPILVEVREPIAGGLFPYAHLGMRTPLRYDWRLAIRLRYDPVFPVLTTYSDDRLVGALNYHSYRTMESAFNWTIELALAKLVF